MLSYGFRNIIQLLQLHGKEMLLALLTSLSMASAASSRLNNLGPRRPRLSVKGRKTNGYQAVVYCVVLLALAMHPYLRRFSRCLLLDA